ncbi:MAG: TrmB family transcriptional regulator [Candidatus Odinarchaeota archaeon]|nr:TrmB family transcriptional regulator [Candidatus Odinarchaeota archaeon]
MKSEDLVSLLTEFGLTQYEARAYVSLLELGRANANQIATRAEIPRPKIYETMQSLIDKGLAFATTTTPVEYIANDPEKVVTMLSERYLKAAERLKVLLANLKAKQQAQIVAEEIIFAKNEASLIQETKDRILKSQIKIEIFDINERILANEDIVNLLATKKKEGVFIVIYTIDLVAKKISHEIASEIRTVSSEFYTFGDTYLLFDNNTFVIWFSTRGVSNSYVGCYGSLEAVNKLIKFFLKVAHKESKLHRISEITEVDPLKYVKIVSPEMVIAYQKISYIEPKIINYEQPYSAFMIITSSRIIFLSVYGSDSKIVAIPRPFVLYVTPLLVNGDQLIRITYMKVGHYEEILVKVRDPQAILRAFI